MWRGFGSRLPLGTQNLSGSPWRTGLRIPGGCVGGLRPRPASPGKNGRSHSCGGGKPSASGGAPPPPHPKEEPANYRIRVGRPPFFNAFLRTLDGLVGMVFRTSPELGEDVPKVVEEHWENIDKEGNHGEVFLKTVFADALEAGHCAIFVDYPAIPNPATVTRADERALDLRPYWVHVRKDEVMNFRTSRSQGGERVLDQITLRFRTHEQDEAFGDKLVVRYRVYQRIDGTVRWEIWQEGEDKIPRPTGERGG